MMINYYSVVHDEMQKDTQMFSNSSMLYIKQDALLERLVAGKVYPLTLFKQNMQAGTLTSFLHSNGYLNFEADR